MAAREPLLMVADSEHDANMLYATGVFVPDAFVFLRTGGRDYVIVSDLEIDRIRRQAPHCKALPLGEYLARLRTQGLKNPGLAEVIPLALRELRVTGVTVPWNFPHGLALDLAKAKVRVRVRPGTFFPEREEKTADEVKKISAALMMAEIGMDEAMQVLKACKIGKDRRLLHRNVPLTSEKLRSVIDTAILNANGLASHTIVAGGRQGCDPHEIGHGPLRAHEPIILDIFPRSQSTGYFGDITRTVVRGRASESIRRLYDTVLNGQRIAFEWMRPAVPTCEIHRAVQKYFDREGFKTGKVNGRMQGFFHGTGHGLGLEIHEAPRVGPFSTGELKPGQVVTVEPGLYYPDLGGVRIEDVALVTKGAAKNLTRFEKVLEI